MSYQEKRTVFTILTGALVLAAYCIYAFGGSQAGIAAAGDLKYWARTMLIFIGIGIVTTIVIQIVFHILLSIGTAISKKIQDPNFDEKTIEKTIELEMVDDEMHKLIELKSTRIGFFITGIGFILGLESLLLDYSPVMMLNILFISASVGSLIEGFTQLYYYRRGIQHG